MIAHVAIQDVPFFRQRDGARIFAQPIHNDTQIKQRIGDATRITTRTSQAQTFFDQRRCLGVIALFLDHQALIFQDLGGFGDVTQRAIQTQTFGIISHRAVVFVLQQRGAAQIVQRRRRRFGIIMLATKQQRFFGIRNRRRIISLMTGQKSCCCQSVGPRPWTGIVVRQQCGEPRSTFAHMATRMPEIAQQRRQMQSRRRIVAAVPG